MTCLSDFWCILEEVGHNITNYICSWKACFPNWRRRLELYPLQEGTSKGVRWYSTLWLQESACSCGSRCRFCRLCHNVSLHYLVERVPKFVGVGTVEGSSYHGCVHEPPNQNLKKSSIVLMSAAFGSRSCSVTQRYYREDGTIQVTWAGDR